MLETQPWIKHDEDLLIELAQATEEGIAFEGLESEIAQIKAIQNDRQRHEAAGRLLDRIRQMGEQGCRIPGYAYAEPSDYEGILKERAVAEALPAYSGNSEDLYSRIYGGWLGRCIGCLIGQPIEGWQSARINGLLTDTDNLPLTYYISSDIPWEIRDRYGVADDKGSYGNPIKTWINNVEHAPEDDDTNYSVIGLLLMEEHGRGMLPSHVGEAWLSKMPYLHLCTAERVAYRNLANGMLPPETACYRNPYREWIGAQIRGDVFGYVSPGLPELAARLCWADASVSHVKNGIYGEMWVGAMLSAAFVLDSPEQVIRAGMCQIPQKSRLYEKLTQVLDWHGEGVSAHDAIGRLRGMYDESSAHHWCHTISNAMIVAIALLWGGKDYMKAMELSIVPGFDTDCNAATAGSVLGIMLGADALPRHMAAPLNEKLRTGIDGLGLVRISDLARRIVKIAEQNRFHGAV